MLTRALRTRAIIDLPKRFAGGAGAKPQKLEDKLHLETAIVGLGEFGNTANQCLGTFCKKNEHEPVAFISDKNRTFKHEFSKDLHAHQAFKNEASTGKGIFTSPKKGHFYKIDSDVIEFQPDDNRIVLQEKAFTYDHMILAAELEFDWDSVKGLDEALNDYWNSHVTTHAQVPAAVNVDRVYREFTGGNFIYAIPKLPHKNEGTNHIFYWYDELKADQKFCSQGVGAKFIITTPQDYIHADPYTNDKMMKMADKRGIEVKFGLELTEVKYNDITDYHRVNEAIFKDKSGKEVVLDYGHLNTQPSGKVPKALQGTKLLGQDGLIPINKFTLQHDIYKNVFSLGECTNLPTVNNCIASLSQSHTIAYNLHYLKNGQDPKKKYDGATATPIFTGKGKIAMPGWDYNGRRVGTKITGDVDGAGAGLKQSFGFKIFGRYWKKYFQKRMLGKIYGPPGWTKPSASSVPAKADPKAAKA